MSIHTFFIGCDISKAYLDIFSPQTGRYMRVRNAPDPIQAWIGSELGGEHHVIFEATGIYDRPLRVALDAAGLDYSRLNPTRTRRFAQAAGYLAKTDRLDARMLSEMGERMRPPAEPALDAAREALAALQNRRDQLVSMRKDEKNRLEAALHPDIRKDITVFIDQLSDKIATYDTQIDKMMKETDAFAPLMAHLRSAPGIGPVTASVLIGQLPELGHRSPKQIAALVGLAPINNDSGTKRGKRTIRGGRRRVRNALYMAALQAARHPRFKAAYEAIKHRSGSAKLALIAIARKLLTILNAMVRDQKMFAQ